MILQNLGWLLSAASLAGPAAAPAEGRAPLVTAPAFYRCTDASGRVTQARLPVPGARCIPVEVHVPAGWQLVAAGGSVDVFIHPALGTPPPGLTKVWVLYSLRAPKGPPGPVHLSAKSLEFHSCQNGTFAVGTTIEYSKPLGEGEIVETQHFDKPRQMEIPPDTASAWVWKAVCAP